MKLFTDSVFFGVTITLFTYFLGVWVKSKLKLAIFNPLLISIVLIILFLAFRDKIMAGVSRGGTKG